MEAIPLSTPVDPAAGAAVGPAAAPLPDPWPEQFSQSLRQQHSRVRAFLDTQRQRWRQVEALLRGELERRTAETETLRRHCAELQQELAARQADRRIADQRDELAGRYELALEDIRELKARNAELQRLLDQPAAAVRPAGAAPAAGGNLNWEAQKRRLLASLESDAEEDGPSDPAERWKIEEIVRRTDELLAEKDRRIEQLEAVLAHHDQGGHDAAAALLDQDEVVRRERENLRQLQEQWREKLRQAEIELSVERANLARRQAEIEDRLRALQQQTSDHESGDDALAATGRPARGRWLARLGLSDTNPPPRAP